MANSNDCSEVDEKRGRSVCSGRSGRFSGSSGGAGSSHRPHPAESADWSLRKIRTIDSGDRPRAAIPETFDRHAVGSGSNSAWFNLGSSPEEAPSPHPRPTPPPTTRLTINPGFNLDLDLDPDQNPTGPNRRLEPINRVRNIGLNDSSAAGGIAISAGTVGTCVGALAPDTFAVGSVLNDSNRVHEVCGVAVRCKVATGVHRTQNATRKLTEPAPFHHDEE